MRSRDFANQVASAGIGAKRAARLCRRIAKFVVRTGRVRRTAVTRKPVIAVCRTQLALRRAVIARTRINANVAAAFLIARTMSVVQTGDAGIGMVAFVKAVPRGAGVGIAHVDARIVLTFFAVRAVCVGFAQSSL